MNRPRLFAAVLLFLSSLPLLFACEKIPSETQELGNQVSSNQGDYFLYALLILSAVILLGLIIFILIQRRRK